MQGTIHILSVQDSIGLGQLRISDIGSGSNTCPISGTAKLQYFAAEDSLKANWLYYELDTPVISVRQLLMHVVG